MRTDEALVCRAIDFRAEGTFVVLNTLRTLPTEHVGTCFSQASLTVASIFHALEKVNHLQSTAPPATKLWGRYLLLGGGGETISKKILCICVDCRDTNT